MATVITHFVTGGVLGLASPAQVSRRRVAVVLGTLAMLPDLDVIGFSLGIAYGDMLGHRGFTHSIVFAVLAGLITPALLFRTVAAFSADWWRLAGLACAATLSHGVLDAFTDAGLGVGFLIPFDDGRYFAPWRPIATSPLGVSAFINGPALRILANELLWVGLPLGCVLASGLVLRAVRRRRP